MTKYVCDMCGWIHDPARGDPSGEIALGRSFCHLPDHRVCPECGASKRHFSLLS